MSSIKPRFTVFIRAGPARDSERHDKWHKHQCRNTALKHQGPRGDHDSRQGAHGNSGGFNTTNQEKTMKIGKISFDVHFEPSDGKFFVTMEQEFVTLPQEEFQQGTHTGNVEKSKSPDEVQLDPDSTPSKRIKPPSNKRDIFSTGLPRLGAKRRDPRRLMPTAPKTQHRRCKPTGLEMLLKSSCRKTTRTSPARRMH